ncbi:MAG: Sulfate transport system permease protein CysW, partial [uncultured Craurococcus sp.]
ERLRSRAPGRRAAAPADRGPGLAALGAVPAGGGAAWYVPAAAAGRGLRRGAAARGGAGRRCARRSGCAGGGAAHPAGRGDRGAGQPGRRRGGGLGDRQIRLPRQAGADGADRAALLGLAGDLGARLRAGLRGAGLARALARGAGRAGGLRPAGAGAGDHLRHLPLRGADADPADAGPGADGGGGGGDARRERVADVPACDAAEHPLGPAVRGAAVQCAGDGGVRGGVGRLRPCEGGDQHHAAACRDPLQRVPVRRGLRGGRPAGAAGAGDARRQGGAGAGGV